MKKHIKRFSIGVVLILFAGCVILMALLISTLLWDDPNWVKFMGIIYFIGYIYFLGYLGEINPRLEASRLKND